MVLIVSSLDRVSAVSRRMQGAHRLQIGGEWNVLRNVHPALRDAFGNCRLRRQCVVRNGLAAGAARAYAPDRRLRSQERRNAPPGRYSKITSARGGNGP